MECKYTCYDRVLYMIKPCSDEKKLKDIVYLIQYDGLSALLDYCVQEKLLPKSWSDTIFDSVIMWEDLDGNYYEEDYDKLLRFYEAIGATEGVFNKFMEK